MRPASKSKDTTKKKVTKKPFFNFGGDSSARSGRPRAGTFVRTADLKEGGESLTATANEVVKSKLKSGSKNLITSTDRTVFFKKHGNEAFSQYAVASTRMARFLGMPNLIAHNAFGRINKVEGVVAGRVPGQPMMETEFDRGPYSAPEGLGPEDLPEWAKSKGYVRKSDGQYYAMTAIVVPPVDLSAPVVQKGLSDLQLFDAITGQGDRHGANIFIDPVTGQVTGIDDDSSFHAGQRADDVAGERSRATHYKGLPALVDERTAQMIIDSNPADLPYQLARRRDDTEELTEDDIANAQRRLVAVRDYLRDLKAQGRLVRVWNDATYRRAAQDPDGSYLGRQAEMQDKAAAGEVEPTPSGNAHYQLSAGPRIPQQPLDVNPANATAARQELVVRPRVTEAGPSGDRTGRRRNAVLFTGAPTADTAWRPAQARLRAQGVDPVRAIGDPDGASGTSSSSEGLRVLSGADEGTGPEGLTEIERQLIADMGGSVEQSGFRRLTLSEDDVLEVSGDVASDDA